MASTNKDKLKELLGKIAVTTNTITVEDDINHYTILELLNALRSNVKELEKLVNELDEATDQELLLSIKDKPNFENENVTETMLGAFFVSGSDIHVNLYHSSDGVHFERITENPKLEGRDPSILYLNGKYYIATTGYNPHDFVIHESKNLTDWTTHYISAGLYKITSLATKIWAPEFFVDDDGTVYILVSVRIGTDVNIKGQTVDAFAPYIIEMDMETLTPKSIRNLDLESGNKIDPAIIKKDNVYYMFIKDEYDLNIEIWTSPNLFTWTKVSDKIEAFEDRYMEGPSVVKKDNTYYLYADAFYEPYVYVTQSSDLINWETCEPIRCDNRTRHGSVTVIKDRDAKMILNDMIVSNHIDDTGYAKIYNLGSLATDGVIEEFNPFDNYLYQSFAANGDIVINKVGNRYNSRSFSVVLRTGAVGSITIKKGSVLEMTKDLVIKPDLGNADTILVFEWVDELKKFKPTFLNTEVLFANQAIRPGYKRIYLDDGTYASGSTITLNPDNGALYTIGGTFQITINGIDTNVIGDRIYLGVFSNNANAKIILKTGTNLTVPGGSYEISVAQGNNEKIIELVRCAGTAWRLRGN